MDSIWIQLIIEFVGAFLGFLFAVLLSGVSEKAAQRKKLKTILRSLDGELQDIAAALWDYIDKNTVLHARIAIPIWNALQNSGMLLDLIGKDYFNVLVNAYARIEAYNEDRLYNHPLTVDRMREIAQVCETALKELKK